jgi:hypothetical protein
MLKPPNIPALSSKVDIEVRRVIDSIKSWFISSTADGGVMTRGSLSQDLAATPAVAALLDGTIPPQLSNVAAAGAFRTIILTWDDPRYRSFAYAEIWRATVDDLGVAVRIGATQATLFADLPPNASLSVTYFYWARIISVAGITGPFNATAGTPGSTADDPAYMLEVLTDRLSETQLATDLNSRIDLIDTPVTGLVDTVQSQANSLLLKASTSYVDDKVFEVASMVGPETAIVFGEDVPNALFNLLFAAKDAKDEARVNTANMAVAQIDIKSNADAVTALAEITATTQTVLDGNIATVQTQQESINGIYAQYTIKTDVNGKVAGIGLMNDGATSAFIINVDEFAIAGEEGDVYPFIVCDGVVYINEAAIKNGTITNAMIGLLAVDAARIADAAIGTIKVADGAITDLKIGNTIQSTNYVPGAGGVGWLIDKAGTIRGQGIIVGTAAVDTLQIKGNAVTIPVGIEAANSFAAQSDILMCSLVLPVDQAMIDTGKVLVTATGSISTTTGLGANAGATILVEARRPDGSLKAGRFTTVNNDKWFGTQATVPFAISSGFPVDAVGNWTFKVWLQFRHVDTSSLYFTGFYQTYQTVLGAKR